MLAVQVQYQGVQETIRHDLVTESIGWNEAESQRMQAEASTINANANVMNAKTNYLNYKVNKYNAKSNRITVLANKRNAQSNAENAISNRISAYASQTAAGAAVLNARANQENADVNYALEPSREAANYGSIKGTGIISAAGGNKLFNGNIGDTFRSVFDPSPARIARNAKFNYTQGYLSGK